MNHNGITLESLTHNGVEVQSWIHNGVEVFSAGHFVTYKLNGKTYIEKVKKGDSVLSPSSFTPTVSGASFLGWSTSSSSTKVVSSLVMGDKDIKLYGVYKFNDKSFSVSSSTTYGSDKSTSVTITASNYSNATLTITGSGTGYGSNGTYARWDNTTYDQKTQSVTVKSSTLLIHNGYNDNKAKTAKIVFTGKTVVG